MPDKVSGLGSIFLVGAIDLSGDTGAITAITSLQALSDQSAINVSGTERIGIRRDGMMGYQSFWNPSAASSVIVHQALQTQTQITVVKGPGGLGAYAASLLAIRGSFVPTNGQDGTLGITGDVQGNRGVPVEWGRTVTNGKQTFTATQVIAAWTTAHAYSLNDLVVPTTANGHYYKATTAGTSAAVTEPTWPTNGTTVADGLGALIWTDQGLLPNGIDRGSGSASDHGLAAYLHAFSIGSGTANVKLQDSSDRIAWADIPATTFTGITGATTQRVVTSTTENVKRYVRIFVSGTFTNLVAAVNVVVYKTA